jgi:hypothetical protein
MVTTKTPEIWQCVQKSLSSVNDVSPIFVIKRLVKRTVYSITLGGWGIQPVAVILHEEKKAVRDRGNNENSFYGDIFITL